MPIDRRVGVIIEVSNDGRTYRTARFWLEPVVLVAAGKMYSGYVALDQATVGDKLDPIWIYTEADMLAFADKWLGNNNKHREHLDKWYYKPHDSWAARYANHNIPQRFLEIKGDDRFAQTFIDQRLSLALLTTSGQLYRDKRDAKVSAAAYKDVNLADIEFYRVIDAYTMFQELEMYIGGVLPRPGAMTATIADKDRIVQHGFDKWSFRKPPKSKS